MFSGTEILGKMAMERMLAGLSTRRYGLGLEPVSAAVTESARATSKSAVSRRFVKVTETALADLLAADPSGLNLVALMVDGVHFAETCCVVALGIGIDGTKHPLALVGGSTENATLVTELCVGLRERSLDVTQPVLVVLDGSKALRRAVLDVLTTRCLRRIRALCGSHAAADLAWSELPAGIRCRVGATLTNVKALSLTRSGRLGLVEARGLEEVPPGGDVRVPE